MVKFPDWHPKPCPVENPYAKQCSGKHYGYKSDKANITACHLDTPYFKIVKTDGSTVTIQLAYVTKIPEIKMAQLGNALILKVGSDTRWYFKPVTIDDASLADSLQKAAGVLTPELNAVIIDKVKPILERWKSTQEPKDSQNECTIS
jgi:hypothetical protein